MALERAPRTGTTPGTRTVDELKRYRPPAASVLRLHTIGRRPTGELESLADVAKAAGCDFWRYIEFVFPGCDKRPECVNWYLRHLYNSPDTRDGKNRAFKGGEQLPLPKLDWKDAKPPAGPVPVGQPDRTRGVFRSYRWKPFSWLGFGGFNLALYPELGSTGRGVLVVGILLQLQFEDGVSEQPATKGRPLRWTEAEKQQFASGLASAAKSVWTDKHRITTASRVPEIRDVGVVFEVSTAIGGTHLDDHYEVTVRKVDDFSTSSVTEVLGNSRLDSLDLLPKASGQRAAVHEFGHMLGLLDEYPGAKHGIPYWTGDVSSIMNNGETVRDRHYAHLAEWLTQQHARTSQLARKRGDADWDIRFKVNGTLELPNARLK